MFNVPLNLLIVEDNHGQLELLKAQLSTIPNLGIVNCVSTAKEYIHELTINPHINAVLLDEELEGNMNGLEAYGLLQIRGRKVPTVVMTGNVPSASHTADLDIVDTLEKPFTLDRLNMGLNKIRHHIHYRRFLASGGIFVPVISDQIFQLMPSDIVFIESLNRIVYVHTESETFETKVPLKLYDDYLSDYDFVLTHRSCLVNLHKVEDIEHDKIRFQNTSHSAILLEEKASDFMRLWKIFCSKRN